jgi:hypothetical protein
MPEILTPQILRKIIMEEKTRLLSESDPFVAGIEDISKVEAEEVDAKDLADTLAKEIDHIKALKIKENKLEREIKALREAQQVLRKRVLNRLS